MKRLVGAILALLVLAVFAAAVYYVISQHRMEEVQRAVASGRRVRFTGPPPPFCVCHSKNAAMRKMHRSFGLADCTLCHHERLMGKQRRTKPSPKDVRHKMRTNAICLQCHEHRN